MSELQSRVCNVVFGWDMHNFVKDNDVDDRIEAIADAIFDNKIIGLEINKETHKRWIEEYNRKEFSFTVADMCTEIASFLNENGGILAVIETPIPKNITKENGEFKSWMSNGFGYCRISVIRLKGIEDLKPTILEFEENMMEEIYQEENKKVA